jgi:hypothetical protein
MRVLAQVLMVVFAIVVGKSSNDLAAVFRAANKADGLEAGLPRENYVFQYAKIRQGQFPRIDLHRFSFEVGYQ